jgi:hypothetical protein
LTLQSKLRTSIFLGGSGSIKNSLPKKSKWSILKSLFPKKFKKKFLKLKKHQLSDVRIAFRILILAETFVKIEKGLYEN